MLSYLFSQISCHLLSNIHSLVFLLLLISAKFILWLIYIEKLVKCKIKYIWLFDITEVLQLYGCKESKCCYDTKARAGKTFSLYSTTPLSLTLPPRLLWLPYEMMRESFDCDLAVETFASTCTRNIGKKFIIHTNDLWREKDMHKLIQDGFKEGGGMLVLV